LRWSARLDADGPHQHGDTRAELADLMLQIGFYLRDIGFCGE